MVGCHEGRRAEYGGFAGSGRVLKQKTKSLPEVAAVPLGVASAFIVRDRSVLLVGYQPRG